VNAVGATNGSGAASTNNLSGVFSATVGTNVVTFTYTP
jgi:hypothetical protein